MPEVYDDGDTEDDGLKEEGQRLVPTVHLVAEYAKVSFTEALDFPVDLFRALLLGALTEKLMGSEKGREILKTWRRVNNTELDTTHLDFFKGL